MNIIKKKIHIGGMSCVNCQNKIQKELYGSEGILQTKVSYNTGTADIVYDGDVITQKKISDVIKNAGYEVLDGNSGKSSDIVRNTALIIVIISLYIILQQSGILNLLVPGKLADTKMGYGMLFIIGMVTSVHCIAMCGGINLTQCIPKIERESRVSYADSLRPAVLYNLGRVLSYTVTGFVLGLAGMVIVGNTGTGISILFQGLLKIIAGVFMVIMGINMLGIFPMLRHFSLRIPKFIGIKINKKKNNSKQSFIIGLLNGLMPCGPLQSMQIVAFGSGNPFAGALAMFMFSLGTVPLMFGFGAAVSALGKRFSKSVMSVGAVLVVVLGLAMLSQGGSLAGFNLNKFAITQKKSTADNKTAGKTEISNGIQTVNSTLQSGAYPNITVRAGTKVKWIINAPEGSINGCNYKMFIKEYGIEHTFTEGKNVIEFTPEKTGTISYTCWMGMIHGNIYVE